MLEEIIAQKKVVRQQIRELKNSLTPSQKQAQADRVFTNLELLPEFKNAQNIFIYWSLPDELPTHKFIEKWHTKKHFFLPSVADDSMIIKPFSRIEPMLEGCHGIMEPDSSECFAGKIDLVIVPGIAFDLRKNRLGRGKGYYDRFFSNNESIKIGVCFDFQLLENIPFSLHDMKMNKLITPKQIID